MHTQETDPEEDDDEYGSETWLQENAESYAHELDSFEPPPITPASDAEGPGCRLVVNGYKNFLVDPLAAGLDLKKNKVIDLWHSLLCSVVVAAAPRAQQ